MSVSAAIVDKALHGCTLTGRVSRREFFGVLAAFTATVFVAFRSTVYAGPMFDTVILALCLAATLPVIATGWRRLHDIGLPGWPALSPFLLFGSVPAWVATDRAHFSQGGQIPGTVGGVLDRTAAAIAALAVLVLSAFPSHPGPNRYGPNPTEVNP